LLVHLFGIVVIRANAPTEPCDGRVVDQDVEFSKAVDDIANEPGDLGGIRLIGFESLALHAVLPDVRYYRLGFFVGRDVADRDVCPTLREGAGDSGSQTTGAACYEYRLTCKIPGHSLLP
jgi:hypothetical protein